MNRFLLFLLSPVLLWCADIQLPSNFNEAVFPDGNAGFWLMASRQSGGVFSHVDVRMQDGKPILEVSDTLSDQNYVGVPPSIGGSVLAEEQKIPIRVFGKNIVLGAFSVDEYSMGRRPSGLLLLSSGFGIALDQQILNLENGDSLEQRIQLLDFSHHSEGATYAALGKGGMARIDSVGRWIFSAWSKNQMQSKADSLSSLNPLVQDTCDVKESCAIAKELEKLSLDSLNSIQAILQDSSADFGKGLWLGTEIGLRFQDQSQRIHTVGNSFLDTAGIVGLWSNQNGILLVESAYRSKDNTVSSLWTSNDFGKSFQRVQYTSTQTKKRPDLYDSLNVAISSVAFAGQKMFLTPRRLGGRLGGILVLSKDTIIENKEGDSRREYASLLLGVEDGITERDLVITGICSFDLEGRVLLAASVEGGGASVSADSGKTWTVLARRTAVQNGLKEVRMVPSVMREGVPSQIVYRLDRDENVEIRIFNYAMEPVRTLVRSAFRHADAVRSNDPSVDFWDGRDDSGARVSIGLYYVRVKSDSGKEAWGKVMNLAGRR